jgi:hypothetical protein
MIEYLTLPEGYARGLKPEIRGHIWGLFAVAREISKFKTKAFLDQKLPLERECMIAYFMTMKAAHPFPPENHSLGDTVEGKMVDLLYRFFRLPEMARMANSAKEGMREVLKGNHPKDIESKAEYVEFAMQIYEDAFGSAHAQRLQFLDGSYGSRR